MGGSCNVNNIERGLVMELRENDDVIFSILKGNWSRKHWMIDNVWVDKTSFFVRNFVH
jgi:hypothetical protein